MTPLAAQTPDASTQVRAGQGQAGAEARPLESRPLEQHQLAALAALARGNTRKAELELKLALQDNPLDTDSHLLLANLLAQRGEHDQAIVGFQRALTLDPSQPQALYNLGTMLLWRDEPFQAARLLESAVSIRPDHVASYNNLAKAYFLVGLPELAIATYEEVLRRDPSNAIAWANLAALTERADNDEAAALVAEPVARQEPRSAEPKAPAPEAAPAPAAAPVPAAEPAAAPAAAPGQDTPDDAEAEALRDLLRDLLHVTVEERGGQLVVTGWTSGPRERAQLDRILARWQGVLDLSSDDSGDPNRMLEVDAILMTVAQVNDLSVGHNFLRLIDFSFSYFATDHHREGDGFTAPGTIGAVSDLAQHGWLLSAAADYMVNIANALDQRTLVLARPHLTTLSGTPASFLAGGELVFRVQGIESGDIKPYPFGTTLKVTPTLLRTQGEEGSPLVHMAVEASRTSVLTLLTATEESDDVAFQKVSVTSQAVLALGQTLILSGLNQQERVESKSGVPVLRDIPVLKYFFSSKTTVENDNAVIILLTPRDPAFWDERNRRAIAEFVELRRAFVEALQGGEEEVRRFREGNPGWAEVPPNRYASHFFLTNQSELYRNFSGQDLAPDALQFEMELQGEPAPNKRKKGKTDVQ